MSNGSILRLAAIGVALMSVACSRQVSPPVDDARALSSADAAWWAPSLTLQTGSADGAERIDDTATLWWLTSARALAIVKGETAVVVYPPPCRDTAEFVVAQHGSSRRHRVGKSGVKLILGKGTTADKLRTQVTFDVLSAPCNLSGSPDKRTFYLGIVQADAG